MQLYGEQEMLCEHMLIHVFTYMRVHETKQADLVTETTVTSPSKSLYLHC